MSKLLWVLKVVLLLLVFQEICSPVQSVRVRVVRVRKTKHDKRQIQESNGYSDVNIRTSYDQNNDGISPRPQDNPYNAGNRKVDYPLRSNYQNSDNGSQKSENNFRRQSGTPKPVKNKSNNGGGDDHCEGCGSGIPGEAGVDYPTYTSLPSTNFECSKQQWPGYYADVDSRCQVFWICQKNRADAFLCPNGTLFNQQVFVCDWWFNVDCGSASEYYSRNQYIYAGPGVDIQGNAIPIKTEAQISQENRRVIPSNNNNSNNRIQSSNNNFGQSNKNNNNFAQSSTNNNNNNFAQSSNVNNNNLAQSNKNPNNFVQTSNNNNFAQSSNNNNFAQSNNNNNFGKSSSNTGGYANSNRNTNNNNNFVTTTRRPAFQNSGIDYKRDVTTPIPFINTVKTQPSSGFQTSIPILQNDKFIKLNSETPSGNYARREISSSKNSNSAYKAVKSLELTTSRPQTFTSSNYETPKPYQNKNIEFSAPLENSQNGGYSNYKNQRDEFSPKNTQNTGYSTTPKNSGYFTIPVAQNGRFTSSGAKNNGYSSTPQISQNNKNNAYSSTPAQNYQSQNNKNNAFSSTPSQNYQSQNNKNNAFSSTPSQNYQNQNNGYSSPKNPQNGYSSHQGTKNNNGYSSTDRNNNPYASTQASQAKNSQNTQIISPVSQNTQKRLENEYQNNRGYSNGPTKTIIARNEAPVQFRTEQTRNYVSPSQSLTYLGNGEAEGSYASYIEAQKKLHLGFAKTTKNYENNGPNSSLNYRRSPSSNNGNTAKRNIATVELEKEKSSQEALEEIKFNFAKTYAQADLRSNLKQVEIEDVPRESPRNLIKLKSEPKFKSSSPSNKEIYNEDETTINFETVTEVPVDDLVISTVEPPKRSSLKSPSKYVNKNIEEDSESTPSLREEIIETSTTPPVFGRKIKSGKKRNSSDWTSYFHKD